VHQSHVHTYVHLATHHATLSYLQAIVIGLVQGVTELFPVSSLGHGVLVPALLGWHNLASAEAAKTGFFLAFLVGLHVGTAAGLLVYYRRTWVDLAAGLVAQLRASRRGGVGTLWRLDAPDVDQRYRLLAVLALATVPVAVVGLLAEKALRVLFTKPLDAAIFLSVNGVILLGGEILRRRTPRHVARPSLTTLSVRGGVVIGATQILALLAGISRSGVTMVSGLLRGLSHEDAAEFAFLLATPVILLAGLLKVPDLLGPIGDGVRAQSLVGALVAGVAAYLSVRFLARWFTTRTLWPFGVYSLVVGLACVLRFA
jgi:undecaprenyl-diphosphatase